MIARVREKFDASGSLTDEIAKKANRPIVAQSGGLDPADQPIKMASSCQAGH